MLLRGPPAGPASCLPSLWEPLPVASLGNRAEVRAAAGGPWAQQCACRAAQGSGHGQAELRPQCLGTEQRRALMDPVVFLPRVRGLLGFSRKSAFSLN